jgi:hypothetical protein
MTSGTSMRSQLDSLSMTVHEVVGRVELSGRQILMLEEDRDRLKQVLAAQDEILNQKIVRAYDTGCLLCVCVCCVCVPPLLLAEFLMALLPPRATSFVSPQGWDESKLVQWLHPPQPWV